MSNYKTKAIRPDGENFEDVMMLDDHFGKHKYGVEFPDGVIYSEDKCTFEKPADVVDVGHETLIKDINDLLEEVKSNEFHDFKNEKYAAPKTSLIQKLNDIIQKAVVGDYDN